MSKLSYIVLWLKTARKTSIITIYDPKIIQIEQFEMSCKLSIDKRVFSTIEHNVTKILLSNLEVEGLETFCRAAHCKLQEKFEDFFSDQLQTETKEDD